MASSVITHPQENPVRVFLFLFFNEKIGDPEEWKRGKGEAVMCVCGVFDKKIERIYSLTSCFICISGIS